MYGKQATEEGDENVRMIHKDDLKVILNEAAEKGARAALIEIGMSSEDPHERDKIREELLEARALAAGVKQAKKEALREVGRWLIRAVIATFIAGIAVKLGFAISVPK